MKTIKSESKKMGFNDEAATVLQNFSECLRLPTQDERLIARKAAEYHQRMASLCCEIAAAERRTNTTFIKHLRDVVELSKIQ